MRLSDYEQSKLDQRYGELLDKQSSRMLANGVCPKCGNTGKILYGFAGNSKLYSRVCDHSSHA